MQLLTNLDELAAEYLGGRNVPELAREHGISPHTLRRRFKVLGIMRSTSSARKLMFSQGKMDGRRTRKGVPQSEEGKRKQSAAMLKKWEGRAKGIRTTSSGYIEYTRGEHAGRSVHVVKMEERIGRRLRADEVVHHIDGDRANNEENNIALMTRSAHTRLHRREDALAGNMRNRDNLGRFNSEQLSCN